MVLGIGCDILETRRLKKWLDNTALQKRYFTKQERVYIQNIPENIAIQRLAGMFSAKEAFIKSIRKGVILTDIVIERDDAGAPRLRLERSALQAFKQTGAIYSHLSISHEKNYAMAMVVIGC